MFNPRTSIGPFRASFRSESEKRARLLMASAPLSRQKQCRAQPRKMRLKKFTRTGLEIRWSKFGEIRSWEELLAELQRFQRNILRSDQHFPGKRHRAPAERFFS